MALKRPRCSLGARAEEGRAHLEEGHGEGSVVGVGGVCDDGHERGVPEPPRQGLHHHYDVEPPVIGGEGEEELVCGEEEAHGVEYLLPAQGVREVSPEECGDDPGNGSQGRYEAYVGVPSAEF